MSHTISRRGLMVAAGGAGLFPASAARTAEPTQDERLRACIIEIRSILERRHSAVDTVYTTLTSYEDGTFRLTIHGTRKYEDYSGEGIYEVSIMEGILAVYWLRKDVQRRPSDGTPIPGGEFFWGRQIYEGEFVDDTIRIVGWPRIVRKLEDWDAGRAIE